MLEELGKALSCQLNGINGTALGIITSSQEGCKIIGGGSSNKAAYVGISFEILIPLG